MLHTPLERLTLKFTKFTGEPHPISVIASYVAQKCGRISSTPPYLTHPVFKLPTFVIIRRDTYFGLQVSGGEFPP